MRTAEGLEATSVERNEAARFTFFHNAFNPRDPENLLQETRIDAHARQELLASLRVPMRSERATGGPFAPNRNALKLQNVREPVVHRDRSRQLLQISLFLLCFPRAKKKQTKKNEVVLSCLRLAGLANRWDAKLKGRIVRVSRVTA